MFEELPSEFVYVLRAAHASGWVFDYTLLKESPLKVVYTWRHRGVVAGLSSRRGRLPALSRAAQPGYRGLPLDRPGHHQEASSADDHGPVLYLNYISEGRWSSSLI